MLDQRKHKIFVCDYYISKQRWVGGSLELTIEPFPKEKFIVKISDPKSIKKAVENFNMDKNVFSISNKNIEIAPDVWLDIDDAICIKPTEAMSR